MDDDEREYLRAHRCHDYESVTERWRAVAAARGMEMEEVAEAGGLPIFAISNGLETSREEGLYVSAGVHGDEPAAVEGLVAWAEKEEEFFERYPVLIFPCLNPAGLEENTRVDHEGRDLNRMFDDGSVAPVREWQARLGGAQFRMALTLHEDYDALGMYLYELGRAGAGVGGKLLRACDAILPRHEGDVEGRKARAGVIAPGAEERMEEILREIKGVPEAIYLYLNHAGHSMTFETPSEYSLYARVRAQQRFLEAVVGWLVRGEG